MSRGEEFEAALDAVLAAAERYAGELLEQASKYEALRQPTVAKLTLDEHYRPLREAINLVRAEGARGVRLATIPTGAVVRGET